MFSMSARAGVVITLLDLCFSLCQFEAKRAAWKRLEELRQRCPSKNTAPLAILEAMSAAFAKSYAMKKAVAVSVIT